MQGFARAKTTIAREINLIGHFITYVTKQKIMNINSVTQKEIVEFMNSRLAVVTPKTVEGERRVVNVFFNWAKSSNLIKKNPVANVPPPFVPKT